MTSDQCSENQTGRSNRLSREPDPSTVRLFAKNRGVKKSVNNRKNRSKIGEPPKPAAVHTVGGPKKN